MRNRLRIEYILKQTEIDEFKKIHFTFSGTLNETRQGRGTSWKNEEFSSNFFWIIEYFMEFLAKLIKINHRSNLMVYVFRI